MFQKINVDYETVFDEVIYIFEYFDRHLTQNNWTKIVNEMQNSLNWNDHEIKSALVEFCSPNKSFPFLVYYFIIKISLMTF